MTSITCRKKSISNPLANEKNDFWVKDHQRFGVKMLMAMGWSPGKGLGLNEDGCPDAIKVRLKNDIKGVGYKERDDQWVAHQDDFNALLTTLNGGRTFTDQECKPQNLEAKSKSSRSRLHYHKLARYKDLSCRSERDLASILGKRSRKHEELDRTESTETESSLDMRQYLSLKKIETEKRKEVQKPGIILDSPPKRPKSKKMKVKKVTFGDVKVADEDDPYSEDKNPCPDRLLSTNNNDQSVTTRKSSKRKKHHKSEDVSDKDATGTTNSVLTFSAHESLQEPLSNGKKKSANGRHTSDTDDSIGPVKKKKKYKSSCREQVHDSSERKPKNQKFKKKSSKKSRERSLMSAAEEDADVSIIGLVESLKTISMLEAVQNNVLKNRCS